MLAAVAKFNARPIPAGVILLGLAAACTPALAEPSAELWSYGGYDTNPYRLHRNESSAGFVTAGTAGSLTPDRLFDSGLLAKGDIETRQYSSSNSDADEWSAAVEVGYRLGYQRASGNSLRAEFGAGYDAVRETYVSRFTGMVATLNGQPIPDRFSFNRGDLFVRLDDYIGRSTKLSLDFSYRDKNYINDYSALGATRFDNTEFEVAPQIRFDATAAIETLLWSGFRQRRYKDRRAEDRSGVDIPGTDLRYDYRELGASLAYTLTQHDKLELGAEGTQRRDNAQGFRDYDKTTLFSHYDHGFSGGRELRLRASRIDRDYRHKSAALDPSELQARIGNGFAVRYLHPLTVSGIEGLRWVSTLEYFHGKHTTPEFEYDRLTLLTGLRKSW